MGGQQSDARGATQLEKAIEELVAWQKEKGVLSEEFIGKWSELYERLMEARNDDDDVRWQELHKRFLQTAPDMWTVWHSQLPPLTMRMADGSNFAEDTPGCLDPLDKAAYFDHILHVTAFPPRPRKRAFSQPRAQRRQGQLERRTEGPHHTHALHVEKVPKSGGQKEATACPILGHFSV